MYNFNWHMLEKDWDNFRKGTGNFCGSVLIGIMLIEFIYDEIQYTNSFVAGVDAGYGYLKDGTPYNLIDDEINLKDALKARSFENFKRRIEESVITICNKYPQWKEWATTEKEIAWN